MLIKSISFELNIVIIENIQIIIYRKKRRLIENIKHQNHLILISFII